MPVSYFVVYFDTCAFRWPYIKTCIKYIYVTRVFKHIHLRKYYVHCVHLLHLIIYICVISIQSISAFELCQCILQAKIKQKCYFAKSR